MVEQISVAKTYGVTHIDNLLQVQYSQRQAEDYPAPQEMLLGGAIYHNIQNSHTTSRYESF